MNTDAPRISSVGVNFLAVIFKEIPMNKLTPDEREQLMLLAAFCAIVLTVAIASRIMP